MVGNDNSNKNKAPVIKQVLFKKMVEATGFEPAASASRTQRSTKLSHASTYII